jgi:hypothetical protein
LAAITGAIAEAYYGVPEEFKAKALSFLDMLCVPFIMIGLNVSAMKEASLKREITNSNFMEEHRDVQLCLAACIGRIIKCILSNLYKVST